MLRECTSFLGVLLLALAFAAAPALAQTYNETGDSGNLVSGTVQDARGFDNIAGTLSTQENDEDCFLVTVDADATIIEVTTFLDTGSGFADDSQAFLFSGTEGIIWDDDSGAGFLSRLDSDAFTANGVADGDYNLCITGFDNDALNSDGAEIFKGSPDPFEPTPNPDVGDAFVASWDDLGDETTDVTYEMSISEAMPPVDEAGDIVTNPAADATGQTTIVGTIGEDADEDCYAIEITNAAGFSAEVLSFDPDGDTQLFLFQDNLEGVYGDDDGGVGLLSLIDADSVAADGGSVSNGDHFLCLTAFNNDPLNSDGSRIFSFGSTPPNPSAGDSTLASWDDLGSLSAPSDYEVSLTGVTGGPPVDLVASASATTVPQGGSIDFTYSITNNTPNAQSGVLFFEAFRGGSQVASGTVISGTVQPGATINGSYTQNVPGGAPTGDYDYDLSIGANTSSPIDTESFVITVTGPAARAAVDFDALIAEAKRSGDFSTYNEAVKRSTVDAGEWTVTGTTPWAEQEAVSAAARTSAVGAFPNPFARSTEIGFSLDEASDVTPVVYDVRGREVVTLADEAMEAGSHTVTFEAANLPSGVYVYRLTTGAQVETGRLTLVQ